MPTLAVITLAGDTVWVHMGSLSASLYAMTNPFEGFSEQNVFFIRR